MSRRTACLWSIGLFLGAVLLVCLHRPLLYVLEALRCRTAHSTEPPVGSVPPAEIPVRYWLYAKGRCSVRLAATP